MTTPTLEVSREIIGARTKPLEIEVTPRMIMNYAAGIDDANPWHFDDTRPEGIVAPPMMTWAFTWRFSAERDRYWGDAGLPREFGGRSVHYTEDMRWTRPIRPGDRLTIEGEIVELKAHRSGTYMKTRYVGVDALGDRVFTEDIGGMLRDVRCAEELGPYVPEGPGTTFEAPGDPIRKATIPIHPFAAHIYDGCADIHNPIHTSKAYALNVGLPDIILHGTATLAYAIRDITNTEGGGNPCAVRRLGCSFTGMVFMGTQIELQVLGERATDTSKEVFFQVISEDGRKAIRNGWIEFTTD